MEDKENRIKYLIIGMPIGGTLDEAAGILKRVELHKEPVCIKVVQNWAFVETKIDCSVSDFQKFEDSYMKFLGLPKRYIDYEVMNEIQHNNLEFEQHLVTIKPFKDKLDFIHNSITDLHAEWIMAEGIEIKRSIISRLSFRLSRLESILNMNFIVIEDSIISEAFELLKNIYVISETIVRFTDEKDLLGNEFIQSTNIGKHLENIKAHLARMFWVCEVNVSIDSLGWRNETNKASAYFLIQSIYDDIISERLCEHDILFKTKSYNRKPCIFHACTSKGYKPKPGIIRKGIRQSYRNR